MLNIKLKQFNKGLFIFKPMQNLVLLYSSRPPICINATKAGHLDIEFSSTSNITIKSGDIVNSINCDRRFLQIERCGDFVVGLMECGKVDIYNVFINEEDGNSKKQSELKINEIIKSIVLKKVSSFQTASSCFTFSSAKSLLLFGDLTIVSLTTFQSHRILEQVFKSVALNPLHSHILLVSDANRIAIFDLKAKREIYTSNVACKSVMWHPTDPLKVIFVSDLGIKYLCLKTGAITDFCEGTMIKYSDSVFVIRDKGLVVYDGWKKIRSELDVDFDLKDGMIATNFDIIKIERFMAVNGAKKFIFITRNRIIHKKMYKYAFECEIKNKINVSEDEKILELIPHPEKLKNYLNSLVEIPASIKLPTSVLEAILSKSDFSLDKLSSYEFILLANYLKKQDLLAQKGDIKYWPLLLLTANKNIIERLEGEVKLAAIAVYDTNSYFEAKTKSLKRPETIYDWACFMNKIEKIIAMVRACNGEIYGDEYEEYKKFKNIITKPEQENISENAFKQSIQNNIFNHNQEETKVKDQNNAGHAYNTMDKLPGKKLTSTLNNLASLQNTNVSKPITTNSVLSTGSSLTINSHKPMIPGARNESTVKNSVINSVIQSNPSNIRGVNIPARHNSIPNLIPKISTMQNTPKNNIIPNVKIPSINQRPNNQASLRNLNIPSFSNSSQSSIDNAINNMKIAPPKQPVQNNNSMQSSNASHFLKRNMSIPQPQKNINSPTLSTPKPYINPETNKPEDLSPKNQSADLLKMITERLNHLINLAKTKKGILIQSRVIACIRDVQPVYTINDNSVLHNIYKVLTDKDYSLQYENVSVTILNAIVGLRSVCNE